ncbi:hypothetical protein P280DRAFT_522535 [Massarina eburnea CBS 473.64]|uniref:Uncharacterized protein n=1 Tax=Massarina eburnea CBS 473.64 TaxID=1395130 RepID=A0A6A6RL46_9PLEO|nr:hypothetical protein P280DRAFT_522535 [Massarina eburnea CBS 473.64]
MPYIITQRTHTSEICFYETSRRASSSIFNLIHLQLTDKNQMPSNKMDTHGPNLHSIPSEMIDSIYCHALGTTTITFIRQGILIDAYVPVKEEDENDWVNGLPEWLLTSKATLKYGMSVIFRKRTFRLSPGAIWHMIYPLRNGRLRVSQNPLLTNGIRTISIEPFVTSGLHCKLEHMSGDLNLRFLNSLPNVVRQMASIEMNMYWDVREDLWLRETNINWSALKVFNGVCTKAIIRISAYAVAQGANKYPDVIPAAAACARSMVGTQGAAEWCYELPRKGDSEPDESEAEYRVTAYRTL